MKYSGLWIDLPDCSLQWVGFLHRSSSVNHDQSGSTEAGEGLTESAPRNYPVSVQGLGRVDYNDVEIAMQPPMLEPIIQNENRGRTTLQDLTAGRKAVCRYSQPDRRNVSPDESRLISYSQRRNVAARGNYPCRSTRQPAIAPA